MRPPVPLVQTSACHKAGRLVVNSTRLAMEPSLFQESRVPPSLGHRDCAVNVTEAATYRECVGNRKKSRDCGDGSMGGITICYRETPALNHKARNHPMRKFVLIRAALDVMDKILHGDWF